MFFFFKRKTAYELRISDWSSDVCSSDLLVRDYLVRSLGEIGRAAEDDRRLARACDRAAVPLFLARHEQIEREVRESAVGRDRQFERIEKAGRSEEHTSELQSLMRISYAVFCLKKKKTQETQLQKTNDNDQ